MAQRWNNDWFTIPGQHVFDMAKQQITAISRQDGHLDLFVIGFDNRVWTTWWNQTDGWQRDWTPLPGRHVFDHTAQQVTAVSRAEGNLDLFVIGYDNHIYTTAWSQAGGWWPDWSPVPGQHVFDRSTQRVAAVSRTPGHLDLFVIGYDKHIWTSYWTQTGNWQPEWRPVPGQHVFDPATQQVSVASRTPDNLDLFVIGYDKHIWTSYWSGAGNWQPEWRPVPGQHVFDPATQQVSVVSRGRGNLDLFVIGYDKHIWTNYWTQAGNWQPEWVPVPGQHIFDPDTQRVAAVSRTQGQLDLFVVGLDGRIWTSFWNEAQNWLQEWTPIPGKHVFEQDVQHVAAVARTSDHLDLFVIGYDNHIWSTHWGEHAADRPWAVMLCRFQGEAVNPALEAPVERFFEEAFTPGTGGLVEYWIDVSLGGVDVTGSRVFDWVEIDIPRIQAGGIGRVALIDAAIRASRAVGRDPITGFHSQIAVYPHNWAKDGAPPDADWRTPGWAPFWIDGSADGAGRVCLTPPFNGNVTAHEMGHGFGMNHDIGADLDPKVSDYADPACIMSQNGSFALAPWNVGFGPALCVPHLLEKGWLPPGRLYHDDGGWMSRGAAPIPLAPVSHPEAAANLGIRLSNIRAEPVWDYYLEYCLGEGWNRGVAGAPYLLIRRYADPPGTGRRPVYLMALHFEQAVGAVASVVEPSGNVRFTVEVTKLPGPILSVTAEAL